MEFDLASFKSWLYTQDDNRVLGEDDYRCETCPIATFLVEGLGYEDAEVWLGTYAVNVKEPSTDLELHPLPLWAETFVELYDVDGINVKDAKAALEQVELYHEV